VKTARQVAATGDFPIGLWGDAAMRDAAWEGLRRTCAGIAAAEGETLTGEETGRSVIWMRLAGCADGDLMPAECARDDAEFVRLRLMVLAGPR
jgi:hypothetical protein